MRVSNARQGFLSGMYIVSGTTWEDEYPRDKGYHETEDMEEALDAARSALDNGATQVCISVEYDSEGYDNTYEG